MKREFTNSIWIRKYLILCLIAALHYTATGQISHRVAVTSNVFTPDDITINAGDTVIWANTQGRHNVNGLQSKFPSNPESFGNSVGSDWVWSYVFSTPGVYDYQCDPHVSLGMVGKVTVHELPPDTLTVNFTGMTQHVGQTGSILVVDDDTGEEIERSSGTIEETFSLVIPGIVTGHSYTIDIFADLNGNGYYDAPPTDHAWSLELNDTDGNEVVEFVHNTDFKDIEWDHRVFMNLGEMTQHLGEEIYFALIETESGEIIDRESETVTDSFSVELSEIMPGKAYHVDFFVDHNNNGYYDAPPADHAWRLEIPNASGDEVIDFVYNTNFTDVEWMHRLRVRFSGMTFHLGQMLTLYVRESPSGNYLDTIVVDAIEGADFDVKSHVIEPGKSYVIDFYADLSGNGIYNAPPTDHAWRIEVPEVMGDVDVEFIHNTDFTDILSSLGPDILLVEDPELGWVLTDGSGFTLYYFTKDALPDTSLCRGGCVTNWPLFYTEDPELGEGLEMADFSSIEHPEGGMQTTYKGWPLYYFVNDLNPGETNGEAIGNAWFVAKPDYSIMLMDGLLIGADGITYNTSYEPGEEMVQYFVDENGMTLYIFVNDTYDQNNFTASDFSNDHVWPIYEEELQGVASTLDRSLFSSIDVFGRQQLTYKGWPLYYFGADTDRGDATGVSVPSPGKWPVALQGLDSAAVTSVKEFNVDSRLRLYPNPASDKLTIISDETIESISIINVVGARIHTYSNIQALEYQLSLEDINSGVYFVEVKSADHKTRIGRLVKR